MGLGGYLAGKSDVEHYATERAREQLEIEQRPEIEAAEVLELLQSHGLTAEESAPVVEALRKRPEAWRDFMLRFELGLEKPDPRRALTSAVVIASAYVVGGLIPLGPYMALSRASAALPWSIAVTGTALAVFGWVKGRFTGARPARSALQTLLIGGLAAAAAFLIARAHSKLLLWLDGWRGKRPREARTRPSGVGAPHPEESMPQSTRRSDALSARSSGDSATWNPADMASLSH